MFLTATIAAAYREGYFVRWTIIDKTAMRDTAEKPAAGYTAPHTGLRQKIIGTIELLRREKTADYFSNAGILRLDLASDYETQSVVSGILELIIHPAFPLFGCTMIATKAIAAASERRKALAAAGFAPSPHKLIGFGGTEYGDYFTISLS